MKNKLLNLMVAALLITACRQNTAENQGSEQTNDSLKALVAEKNEVITHFLSLFNSIQAGLDSIGQREQSILYRAEKTGDVKPAAVEEINRDINAINTIIKENHEKIASANRKLNSVLRKNSDLEKAINALNQKLADKESDLETLKKRLYSYDKDVITLETVIGVLNVRNAELEERLDENTALLHTAYYIIGSNKALQENNIIDKTGGLLGLGKTTRLKSDVNVSKFIKIDYTRTVDVALNCRNVKIITNHPAASYHLERNNGLVRSLVISDVEKFWSVSKYLVIVTD